MGKVKEYRRICRRCQTQWYIPRSIADEKAPSRITRGLAGSTKPFFSAARHDARHEVLAKTARVAENTRCPSCGSTDFSQQKA